MQLTEDKDSYVIGGESIYKLFLPFANKIELTRVHQNYDGDAFFPEVNWSEWNLLSEEINVNRDGVSYSFLIYYRK